MALLHRLFSSKKSQKEVCISLDKNKSQSWKPFDFNKDQVRILLFRECELRGRKLLFDSKAVNKISLENQSCKQKHGSKMKTDSNSRLENYVEITDGYGYQYTKPSSDTLQLGEMVFGSVAMSFQGSTLKVHQLKSPSRVMCTKVFSTVSRYPYNGNLNERNLEDSFGSSIHSMNEYVSSNGSSSNSKLGTWSFKGSGPVDVPLCNLQSKSNGDSLEIDSGIYGNASLQSSGSVGSENNFNCGSSVTYPTCVYSRQNSSSFPSHASGCSEGSFGGLWRRWSHTINMSLEHCTNSSSCSENTSNSYKHNTKLGLAVLITFAGDFETDMEIFFFEHMILVENIVERLRCSVEQAYLHKDIFVHLMMEGSEKLQQSLEDLFSAPRLASPLWLRLISSPKAETSALVLSFIEDLCYLVANMDTKDTNFFISTLLTAVLTHHLGWVSTVLPEKMMPLNRCKEPCTSKLLKTLAFSHPYNPLWAQLGDLCGALGHPTKVARTIVTGVDRKKVDLLNKILTSLTYFIRCGEISKKTSSRCSKEFEDSLLETSLVQSFPSVINSKTGSLPTVVLDVSSEVISDKTSSHKLDQVLIPKPFSEGESDLDSNSEEIPFQKVNEIMNGGMNLCSANLGTNCSLLIDQTENVQQHDLHQNNNGNFLSKTFMPRVQADENYSLLNHGDDNFLCSSECKIKTNSGNVEHFTANNFINSSISALSNTSKSSSLSFECGAVKYPYLFVNASTELSNYEKSVKGNVSKLVLDGEATCFIENSKSSMGGIKRTSSVMSDLSNSHVAADISAVPVPSNPGLHKEYSKIYPSLAELLMLERGSGLVIEETDNVGQDINSGYFHGNKTPFSRNITEPAISAKSNMTVPCESYVQRKSAFAALSQFDTYVPKKVESERQISSAVTMSKFGTPEIVQKCSTWFDDTAVDTNVSSNGIIFLIGNEQLVGIKSSVHNGTNDSLNEGCDNDSSVVKETICLNSVKNSVPMCETCRTSKIANICHCDHSFLTTKEPKDLLHENDTVLCTCKDFNKLFSCKSDKCNSVTVRSSFGELERENGISEKNPNVEIVPHLSKCASSSFLNGLSKLEHVELCPSKNSLTQIFDKCKNSSYFPGDYTNVFKCTDCRDNQNNKKLQETSKHISSTTSEMCLNVIEERCTINTHSHNCFQSTRGNSVTDNSECSKCVTSPNSCSLEVRNNHPSQNNFITEENDRKFVPSFHKDDTLPLFVELPLLKSVAESYNHKFPLGLAFSLLGATCDHYVSDLILQGCTQNIEDWQMTLRKDLSFVAHHMFLDQEVSEALCIVGNMETWEVQLVSSHTYVVDKPGMFGVRVGMSQLVANMLESLLNLWKMHTPPEHCLLYLESKLREMCLRSQALAELLLKTDFCDMEKLTVTLDLEANDVPLLLAVASTHTPQVTQRYGLCFR